MKPILVAVALHLLSLALPGAKLPPTHPISRRIDAAADAIALEVGAVYPDLAPAEQEKRARVAMTWAYYESSWTADPKGPNDQGAAVGLLQVHLSSFPAGTFPADFTPASVRADLRKGARAGLLAIKYFETKCGSLRDALTAFSMRGECPAGGWTIPLVVRRCKEAGGC